jgi:hypothetical protein
VRKTSVVLLECLLGQSSLFPDSLDVGGTSGLDLDLEREWRLEDAWVVGVGI